LVTVGANFDLRFALLTQFSALVDEALVKTCDQRYFDATWESNDSAYLEGFLGKEWETQEYKRPQRVPVTN
jgi:hypothetical protein